MNTKHAFQVKQVAEITGVSVRTLHYYHEIGLLVPSGRTMAGYRLYRQEDLLKLQQILLSRELGLSLEEIRVLLEDPGVDRRRVLLEQRAQLEKYLEQTAEKIRAVDLALSVLDDKKKRQTMDMKDLFGGFDPAQYDDEARERWGQSDTYRESHRRTRQYKPEDWKRLGEEQATLYGDLYRLLHGGAPSEGVAAMDVAERHRLSIDRWFYPCSYEIHQGLADMYEADERFVKNIDRFGEGLTPYLAAAIRANCRRHQ